MSYGPTRPSEADLKDIVDASDARLGTSSTLIYTPDTVGEVNLDDLAKGAEPVSGGVKWPW
jgi:hypothetical protein